MSQTCLYKKSRVKSKMHTHLSTELCISGKVIHLRNKIVTNAQYKTDSRFLAQKHAITILCNGLQGTPQML